ncbi:MAG: DUF1592 domain-containing protein, partial [Bradymonadaceae bacterium]
SGRGGGSGGAHSMEEAHQTRVDGPDVSIGYGGLRQLSDREFDATIRDLFGGRVAVDSADLPSSGSGPFDNDFLAQFPSLSLIENVNTVAQKVAEIVTDRMREDAQLRDYVLGCGRAPTGADDRECFETFLEHFGRRVMRRPIGTELKRTYLEEFFEMKSLQAIDDPKLADQISEIDFYDKVRFALEAMLQSGQFLYRSERGKPVEADGQKVYRLDDWSMANRLSYFLWGTMPDDKLLDAAAAGELSTPEQIRAQAKRMLEKPQAREAAVRFHAMWLGFSNFYLGETDGAFQDPELAEDARQETRRVIIEVLFEQEKPWTELLTHEKTWLTPKLADHYGLPAPEETSGGWVEYPSDGLRRGILAHASFLALGASDGHTSIIKRSKYLLDHLACDPLPPPQDNMQSNTPDSKPPECKAEHLQWLTERPPCMSCHAKLNGPGMALEHFDGTGQYREYEDPEKGKCRIEGVGRLKEQKGGKWTTKHKFEGPKGLARLLTENMDGPRCMVRHLYQFAVGHKITDRDRPVIDRLADQFEASGYDYQELLLDLVSTPEFRYRIDAPDKQESSSGE